MRQFRILRSSLLSISYEDGWRRLLRSLQVEYSVYDDAIHQFWENDIDRYFGLNYFPMYNSELSEFIVETISRNNIARIREDFHYQSLRTDEDRDEFFRIKELVKDNISKNDALISMLPIYENFLVDLEDNLKDYHLNLLRIYSKMNTEPNYQVYAYAENNSYEDVLQIFKELIISSEDAIPFEELKTRFSEDDWFVVDFLF